MSKVFSFKRVVCIILALGAIAAMVLFFVDKSSYGEDYTEEYSVYNNVKSLTSLDDLREKLQTLKIEYTITSSSLTLKKYDHVSFTITSHNSCFINQDNYMNNFEKMDKEDFSVVEVHGVLSDDSIMEKVTISEDSKNYTKVSNRYYVQETSSILAFLIPLALCVLSVFFIVLDFVVPENKGKNKGEN